MRSLLRPEGVETRPISPMRRREFLYGIGMGQPTDPGNSNLVMVPRGSLLDRVHDALARALRDEPNPIFGLPRGWLHLTLEYHWDPAPDGVWPAPAGGVKPIRTDGGRLEATPWSIRFVPDDQAAFAAAARAFGIDPPDGTVFCVTLAYASDDVPAPAVRRLLTRLERELGARPDGHITGRLRFDRIERRHIAPDKPLCWELQARWELAPSGRLAAVPGTAAMPGAGAPVHDVAL